jgi:hypothetical protein
MASVIQSSLKSPINTSLRTYNMKDLRDPLIDHEEIYSLGYNAM